jgi:hypothetical protein
MVAGAIEELNVARSFVRGERASHRFIQFFTANIL